jgi:SNF2 family DNA or RNA helicase
LQFASSYAETEVENVIDPETGEMKQKVNVFLKAPSNKVDAFMEDLPDFGESQVVVFAASRQLIELLSDKMTKKNIDHGLITGAIPLDEREHYMNTFQDGDLKYILCTTGAGGTGITLTAADTAVYLQRPWSMIESEQSEARVRRIGSEKHESITIIDYVSSGTIDETVIQAIETKSNRLQEILQDQALLKRILEMGDE